MSTDPPPTTAASADGTKSKRRLSWRRKLLFTGLVFAVFGIALIVLEVHFRIRESSPDRPQAIVFTKPDPYRGHVLLPSVDLQPGPNLTTHLRTNSLGHRGPEIAAKKPAGTFRIACLGGSSTWGQGATENETAYPAVLEGLLRAAYPDRSIEVLNAGVLAWNSRASLVNYQLLLEPLEFDLVIVLHCFNDLQENLTPSYREASYAVDPSELINTPSPLRSFLREHSAAYRVLYWRWVKHNLKNKATAFTDEGAAAFARNLRAYSTLVAKGGQGRPRLLFCTYPNLFVPTLDEVEALGLNPYAVKHEIKMSRYAFDIMRKGMDRYNQIIRDVAREGGHPLADLDATYPRDPGLFVDFIHSNDAGHAVRAEQVFEAIQREHLLD